MKKIAFLFVSVLFLVFTPAFAAKNEAGTQNAGTGQQQGQPSVTGNQVQNQNQVKTQNQGEEQQIQTQTQEQESLGEEQGVGSQNMGVVAKQVQQLLQIRTTGGIGEQVRQVAQEQNQAQTQIREQLNKLESRGGILKSLLGPDYSAIKNLKLQLEQNQLRIQQLEQLQNQLSNQGDMTTIQETIQALIQENTSLQDRIAVEEQTKGLFGWLVKLFVK
ncbi:MAG: hypothetical protein ABIC96_00795 [Patescibacteria group bacterium]